MIIEGEFYKKKLDNFDRLYKGFHKASFEVNGTKTRCKNNSIITPR